MSPAVPTPAQTSLLTGEEFARRYGMTAPPQTWSEIGVAVTTWAPPEPWSELLRRVVAHLRSGDAFVVVLSVKDRVASVFRDDAPPRNYPLTATLAIPDLLPGFSAPVARFFE